jgi:hypothetical protein
MFYYLLIVILFFLLVEQKTPLKSGKWVPSALQKSSVQIQKMFLPSQGEKFIPVFKRVLQIQKLLRALSR